MRSSELEKQLQDIQNSGRSITYYPKVFDNSPGKDMRILIIRLETLLILNLDMTRLLGWPTPEVKRQTAESPTQAG
jgi:hypothetical protein